VRRQRRPDRAALGACLTLAVLIGGCSPTGVASPTRHVELTILAAASLKDALDDAKTAYETANPGTTLLISTDSSSALELKIEQGAPADVFLSADMANPQKLVEFGLAAGEPIVFAENELVIVVPTSGPTVQYPGDLAAPNVRIVAAADGVPITTYAEEAVAKLATLAGYPRDFAAAYEANVVSREDNVKAVIAKIELDEGDAAFVYITDALASDKVAEVQLPVAANVRAKYGGVVLRASMHAGEAAEFLSWLSEPPGQEILGRFGFLSRSS
jgi:molybdate transport system substrate-binding protein